MARRVWKRYRPLSLQDAIEACVDYARERHNRSVDQLADDMGIASKWTLYKWIEAAAIPVRSIRPFELACGCTFVTQHLAASARKLLIDLPTGRRPNASDVHAVQDACNRAVGSLLDFSAGRVEADEAITCLNHAIEHLARERAEAERHTQPELPL